MKAHPIRHRISSRHALAMLFVALSSTLAGQAMAGCGGFDTGFPPPAVDRSPVDAGGMMNAVWRTDDGQLMRVDDRDSRDAGIVGTWRFKFISDGTAYPHGIPFGAVVDFGTVQWHSDGTEIMISGARPPSTGDVCMGSWERAGRSSYKLKHIAIAWVSGDAMPPSPSAAYLGPAIIKETVSLNREGDAYEGTFTLDQYAADEVTLLEHISGKVVGKRFSVN